MSPAPIAEIASAISAASGKTFHVRDYKEVSGGCINHGLALHGRDGRRYFVKINQAAQLSMFDAEAAGLLDLDAAQAVRVPIPLTQGIAGRHSYLVMEWLNLDKAGTMHAAALGEQLARLHATSRPTFGWQRDNTIGATPQANPSTDDWIRFYREHRLRPQFELAAQRGAANGLIESGERLLASLPAFFESHTPSPSLLHGDLWSGNVGMADGQPVIFDPAVYYGDRETDIAMTELFGGFPAAFLAAYNAVWPLDPGYRTRKMLYQLYHLLNHFNLFGGAYASQSRQAVDRLLAELK